MTDLYQHIGQKIRELRQNTPKGMLSQEEVAKHIGVTANTLSRWETGTYKPTPLDLDKLARFFGTSITVFFPGMLPIQGQVHVLTSAVAGLTDDVFDEVVRYAEYRKSRAALESAKPEKAKRKSTPK